METELGKNDSTDNTVGNNWSRFSEWIHCMCVVTFDLELGQALEVIYPKNIILSEQEKSNLCYLAFPDSNSGCMGDTQYHIRIRLSPDHQQSLIQQSHQSVVNKSLSTYTPSSLPSSYLSTVHRKFNAECQKNLMADNSHFWGFVYFRQKKDPNIPRGYFQKSFIILTRLPFINLFNEILSVIAPKYFTDGFIVMQSACNQIASWPKLKSGHSLNLPLLGTIYQTYLPKLNSNTINCSGVSNNNNGNICDKDGTTPRNISANKNDLEDAEKKNTDFTVGPTLPPQILTSINDIDIFTSLSYVLPHMYLLWELVLTAEPIVVVTTSPTISSHMVQSLISMISPLIYCGEYRPYFTIHDSEFKEFTSTSSNVEGTIMSSIILGVTNPFFVKLLQNWPTMIRLEQQVLAGCNIKVEPPISPTQIFGPQSIIDVSKKRTEATETLPNVCTKYKPFLKKDKNLIKKILLGIKTKRPELVQSALIRRNLLELTQSFMIPLERYMASLMPLKRQISPFKSAPSPNQFKEDDFLATLEQSGPQLTSPLKGNWKGLYQKFFKSANFKGWYQQRHKELQQKLQALQLQALSDADLNKWAQGRQEVEIVDMIIKLKQKLTLTDDDFDYNSVENCLGNSSSQPSISNSFNFSDFECNELKNTDVILSENIVLDASTRQQLIKQLNSIKQSLPDDLKLILADKFISK